MRIRFTLDSATFDVSLVDAPAARSFAALLPLTLAMRDFHGIEKVADLPERLDIVGEPAGMDPDVGHLTYYAPWGNLAFFYRDFDYAAGLVELGAIEGDASVLRGIADGDTATVAVLD